MSSLTIPQFPAYQFQITLFQNVSNAETIRSKIADLSYAFIDPKLIVSQEQLYSAIYKALIEQKYNRLRTKTLHSECLFCLGPTSNIGDAFKKFGIKDDSRELICLKVINLSDNNDVKEDLDGIIDGERIVFNDDNLSKFYDRELIRKV